MSIAHYLEELNFSSGRQINVSGHVNAEYQDLVHWHPYIEVLVSRCDGNEVTVNFTPYSLRENDMVIVCSGSLHAVHYVTKDSFLVIQFPVALLAIMQEFSSLLPILPRYPVIRYDRESDASLRMSSIVRDIRDFSMTEDPFQEMRIYSKLLALFTEVGLHCIHAREQDMKEDGTTEFRNNELMADACLYIEENCADQLTLEDVTRHLGVSKSHFAHLFKNYTNMTFVDFLTAERVKRSEFFFHNPQMRMLDIAFESGFSSISSFNRSFRRIKGCSPTEFRRTMIASYA